jgi:hypothetical protein
MVSKIKSKKRKNGKQTKATKKSKANPKKKRNIKKTSPTARQKKVSRGTKTRTRTRPTTTTTTTTTAATNPNTEENDLLAIQNNSSLVEDTAKTHEAQEEL